MKAVILVQLTEIKQLMKLNVIFYIFIYYRLNETESPIFVLFFFFFFFVVVVVFPQRQHFLFSFRVEARVDVSTRTNERTDTEPESKTGCN